MPYPYLGPLAGRMPPLDVHWVLQSPMPMDCIELLKAAFETMCNRMPRIASCMKQGISSSESASVGAGSSRPTRFETSQHATASRLRHFVLQLLLLLSQLLTSGVNTRPWHLSVKAGRAHRFIIFIYSSLSHPQAVSHPIFAMAAVLRPSLVQLLHMLLLLHLAPQTAASFHRTSLASSS